MTKKKCLIALLMLALSLPNGVFGQGLFQIPIDGTDNYGLMGRSGLVGTEGAFTHQVFGNNYDGLFTHQIFGNDYDGNFTHQTFGYDVPTGGELLILLTASACYATLKKRKQSKNKSIRIRR